MDYTLSMYIYTYKAFNKFGGKEGKPELILGSKGECDRRGRGGGVNI